VQQFKFLRLSPKLDYEMIAMGLKGLQLSLRPGGFLSPAQYKSSSRHRELFHGLVEWAGKPQALSEPEMMAFLGHIYDGLSTECRGKASHSPGQIAAALERMKQTILKFNDLVAGRRESMQDV
jgi:fido (protein-threonine AMPylation protein)